MKIIILVDKLSEHGGIEKLVVQKANYWVSECGYDVLICTTDQFRNKLIYQFHHDIKFCHLDIGYLEGKSFFCRVNLFKFCINTIKLQALICREKPDNIIVASHIPVTFSLPLLYTKANIIKEIHFTMFRCMSTSTFKSKVMHYVYIKYNTVVLLSEEESTLAKLENSVVIPNFVDVRSKSFEIIPWSLRKDKFVFAGRLVPVKQLDMLFESWSLFMQQNSDYVLEVYGTETAYSKHCAQMHLTDQAKESVRFMGESTSIIEILSKNKCLLLTSAEECFPMVILEAQAAGAAVITFDSPTGPRNIVRDGQTGFLVENGNVNKFGIALSAFVSDKKKQEEVSKEALWQSKIYSLESVMKEWDLLLMKQ